MSDRHEVVRTRSGALAMRSVIAGEVMHPGVGPLTEAAQLYVAQSRLAEKLAQADDTRSATSSSPPSPSSSPSWDPPSPTNEPSADHASQPGPQVILFDIGMGAGTNAALAVQASEDAPVPAARLVVVSFERDLDAMETALSHAGAFGLDGATGEKARALLRCGHIETNRTQWVLEHGDILQALTRQRRSADIVFWDPFSPAVNPTLWTIGAFTAMRRVAGPRCTLFTYSASTAVRVAMLLAGWMVGVGDAIGDKVATTAAAVTLSDLARPLDRRWLARLSRPDVPLPADAPADAIARVSAAPQFSER